MRFLLSLLAMTILCVSPAFAGDDGLTGHWRFNIYQGGQQISFWLLHLESKDGKVKARADTLRGGPKATIDDVKIVGDNLKLRLETTFNSRGKELQVIFDYEGKLPKPGAKKIYGSLTEADGSAMPAILEATSAKNPFELDRDLLLKTPNDPKALLAVIDVIDKAKENKVPAKDLQDWVEGSLKAAEMFGPRILLKQQIRLLDALQEQAAFTAVAVGVARSVSKELDPKTPLDTQSQLLSTIAGILRSGNENADAKAVEARIDKLELAPYAEYSKSALNFKVAKYPGRKAKSSRAVLVELFTGAQCPPCVAADMAFDGVEKTYDPSEVVLLQYHMHIPRPDPMSNPDSEARFDWYADIHAKKVGGTPAALFNGKPEVVGGGRRDDADEKYREYFDAINKLLELPATVKVNAAAMRKGNKIAILANVADLDKPGDKVRLRLALVEDWVRYRGSNGLQYHHRVVRALPGGVKGFALKEKNSEHKASVDLADLRRTLNIYLDDSYGDGPRPMRLRNLSVVAFVQNDDSTEVLQAINVPVREE